jgi:hypothetical protein
VANHLTDTVDGYPWAELQGTVVDMGGGSGHVSVELAEVRLSLFANNLMK